MTGNANRVRRLEEPVIRISLTSSQFTQERAHQLAANASVLRIKAVLAIPTALTSRDLSFTSSAKSISWLLSARLPSTRSSPFSQPQ